MTAVLDLPEYRAQLVCISVDCFQRMSELGMVSERAELIPGYIIEKPPMSPLHRDLSRCLYEILLSHQDAGRLVYREAALSLTDSEPIPDLMVVAGTAADFERRHPSTAELVIEVAVTSEAADRPKAALYAEGGVQEYWIVLAARGRVEVYLQPQGGEYRERRVYQRDEEIVSHAVPGLRVVLSELFAGQASVPIQHRGDVECACKPLARCRCPRAGRGST